MSSQVISNRYKIIEEFSSDPLTILYKAHDQAENKTVLLRFLKDKAKARPLETLLRYKREIEQVSKLSHPNLLTVYSYEEFEGKEYTVLEYCDSLALSAYLSQPKNTGQPMDADVAVDLILHIASALDYVHQNSLLHQAIQPQSILISRDLKSFRLTNLGHNLLTDISRITEVDEIVSTFGYLSPESSGILRKPLDARSDIYSLGILSYQLLTGTLPYTSTDICSLIHQHIAQIPQPLSQRNGRIAPVIESIILRLIAKDPQDRYQSLSGLIADLKEYQKWRAQGKEDIDFEIARSDKLAQLSFSTRIIGRDKELVQLKSFLDQAKQGKGNLCFIYGEPGIGKSRLVDELRGQIHGMGGMFVGGKCCQYDVRTPYRVFAEAMDAYIEKVKRLPQNEQSVLIKRTKETVGELGAEAVKIAPAITTLIGQPPKLVELDPEREKVRFLITVTNFLASLSSPEAPLLMFLDDLQWADEGSLEILERFAAKLENSAILLIVSYRDTEVDQAHPLAQLIAKFKEQKISLSEMPVRAFNLEETSRMVGQILMEKEDRMLPLAQKLYERAKGNPFFTLELLHSLVDANVVYLKEDHYLYDPDRLATASLPSTIVDAVLKRVEDLFESSLQVLSYASVMGKEIDFKMLTNLAKRPFDQILNSIEDGIHNQLLYRDLTGRENVFFMHDRIREAFYRRLPEEERPPLHLSIARILEEENKNNTDAVLYDLAYHFTQGQLEDKALQYCVPAANKAKSAYANTLAINLYNTAKGILEKQNKANTAEYIDVLENLGEVYRYAARFEESLETLKACEQLIPEQDKIHKAQVLSKIGATLFEKGETENSTKVLRQALLILDMPLSDTKVGVILGILKEFNRQMLHAWFPKIFVSETLHADPVKLLQARLLSRLCMGTYFLDKIATVYIWLKSLNFSEKIGPSAELADFYVLGCGAWTTIPWFYRAFRDGYKGMKMAQQVGDKIKEGCGYSYLAWAAYLANKPAMGLEYGHKGSYLLKEAGEYWVLGVGYTSSVFSDAYTGRLKEGIADAEDFIKVTKEAKALQSLGWALYHKAKLRIFIGDLEEENIELLKEALKLAEQTSDKPNIMHERSIIAFLYLRRGDYGKAIQIIEEAIALFPPYLETGVWTLEIFAIGAQVYLDAAANVPDLPGVKRQEYLKRAKWFCAKAWLWSFLFKYFYGWTLQVNGTHLWLSGKKGQAIRTWDKGLHWLRTNKNNPGGDKYRIAYILLEEAKFLLQDNPKDKKAYSNLIEARDLFTEMGCKLDLDTTSKLLESISPEGISVDSRTVLTQKRHLDSLLSVTQAIGSIFILDELLQKILEYGLKVTGAERGFLLLYDNNKTLSLKVSSGLENDISGSSFSYDNYRISLELINDVANTKTASIADQQTASDAKISNELKTFSVRQAIAVPLQTRDKPIGILYLDNRLAGGTFGKEELELMKGFAVQASVSIDNAFLVSNLVEQERLKQELELGKQIQESLLPKESPNLPNLKLIGTMLPAKEIGGDYYDFVIPDSSATTGGAHAGIPNAQSSGDLSSVGIVIGDVSGKGVAAGLLMAMAKTAIHTLSQEETSPKQILLRTNQILVKHIGAQKFMTMLYFRFDTSSKVLTYSSAGHEHILIYRANLNKVESIISGGFMLGMVPDISAFLEEHQITLNPKDKILLYTDGVTEARNPKEEQFSFERLVDIYQKHASKPAEQLLSSIKEEVYAFIDTREQYDDITLVVMEAV